MEDKQTALEPNALSNAHLATIGAAAFSTYKTPALMMGGLLWLVGICPALFPGLSAPQILSVSIIQNILGSVFFSFIVFKVFQKPIVTEKIAKIAGIYLGMWLLTHFHLLLMGFAVPAAALAPVIAVCTITSIYLLGFYFFFIPYLSSHSGLAPSIAVAHLIVPTPRIQAIRIIATAVVASLIIQQLCEFFKLPMFAFSVQQRTIIEILGALSEPIYWFITTFLSVGIALSITDHQSVLSKQSKELTHKKGITHYLLGGQGIGKLLLVAFILAGANVFVSLSAVPSFKVEVASSSYDKDKQLLAMKVTVTNPSGAPLTSFQPMFFRIAGEDGFPLSEMPVNIGPSESMTALTKGTSTLPFEFSFKIINRADDFEKLQDKALWYLNHKLAELPG